LVALHDVGAIKAIARAFQKACRNNGAPVDHQQ
jgi:hypothetical protein